MLHMNIKPQKTLAPLFAAVLCLSSSTAWALLQNDLRGIELNSTPAETRITMKTEGKIPYHVVSQSAEKIVIDFSSIDPTQTVQTDFAAAENIEQVVLKPIGADKLRMVIRGDRMGVPTINSSNAMSAGMKKPEVLFEQESMGSSTVSPASHISVPDDHGNPTSAPRKPQNASADQKLLTGEPTDTAMDSEESAASDGFLNPESDTFLQNQTADPDSGNGPKESGSMDRQPLVDNDSLNETTEIADAEGSWQDSLTGALSGFIAILKDVLSQMDKGFLFGLCAFSGMILLLALLIRKKLSRPNSPFLDEDGYLIEPEQMEEQGPGFLSRIFGGGSNRREQQSARGNHRQHPSRGGERPVGLRGLNQQPAQIPQQDVPSRNLLNRNQAMNQYAQNAQAPMPQAPRYRDSQEIDRELQRSVQMRQTISQTHTKRPFANASANAKSAMSRPQPQPKVQPQTRTPQPQPQPRAQQPLPPARPQTAAAPRAPQPFNQPAPQNRSAFGQTQGKAAPASRPLPQPPIRPQQPNPLAARPTHREPALPENNNEVLDFLRSVADLMEKDGHSELANGVKKGMIPRKRF
jgi:hypothetical protein